MKWLPSNPFDYLRLVLIVLVIYGLIYTFQAKLIFYPQKLPQDFEFQNTTSFSERFFKSNGLNIHSLYFKRENAPGTMVYFHGNAGSMEGWANVAEEMAEKTSWNVWIFDYPGFGKSSGSIRSESQLYQAFKKVIDQVSQDVHQDNLQLIFYGRSIGSGLATRFAAEFDNDGLILESPFYSLKKLAGEKLPLVPTSWLLRFRFDNARWLKAIDSPILILHGSNDEVISSKEGKSLASVSEKARFVEIAQAHHNDLSLSMEYWKALGEFLSDVAQSNSSTL